MNGNHVIGGLEMNRSLLGTGLISFPLDDGSYENLHSKRSSDGLYVLDNSPFYAYDVSFCDEVRAKPINGRLVFQTVAKRGGHSTYRVRLPTGKSHEDFLSKFSELERLGCTYEGTGNNERRLYAIDLPPSSNVADVYQILEDGEKAGNWEFEEAHFFKGYEA